MSKLDGKGRDRRISSFHGFTLLELLVVMAVIATLAALLLPTLSSAQEKAQRAACLSNLRQIGIAITAYSSDYSGRIPFGPKAPAFTDPSDFYPSTGAPTSLLSLQSGAPVALGLMLQHYLASQPRVLFCPASDQPINADNELAKVGFVESQGAYYYRHGGDTNLSDPRESLPTPQHIRLDDLGLNRNGLPIRALAMDTIFVCPPGLEIYGVKPETHHRQRFADILFADGATVSRRNANAQYSVNATNYADILNSFSGILAALEQADTAR